MAHPILSCFLSHQIEYASQTGKQAQIALYCTVILLSSALSSNEWNTQVKLVRQGRSKATLYLTKPFNVNDAQVDQAISLAPLVITTAGEFVGGSIERRVHTERASGSGERMTKGVCICWCKECFSNLRVWIVKLGIVRHRGLRMPV